MGIEYEILGPLKLRIDGDDVPLGTEKENMVLAMLILNANEVVSRDRLIDQLWGEAPPATAVNTVQTYVSRLRKTLHAPDREVLLTRRPGYLLVVEDDAIDADRFERLVVAGREALRSENPEEALELLDEALHLWRGPPLSDFAYQDFASADISNLDELRLMAIETRLTAELELGRHHEVIPHLETLVNDHPLREGLSATLMLALYRDGRQGDALRAFQRVRQVLADELGIEPTQQLQELEEKMLLHDPQLMPDQTVKPATGNLPANLTPLIGRDDDLVSLEELADTARLLTLIGEGGVGKSRLAVELGRRLSSRFEDGVWLAELSGLEDPDHVLATVGSIWRAPESDLTGFDMIEFLRQRKLVLILDNCEAVVDGAAVLAEGILQQAADVMIVATSREPLGCRGEVLWRVRPLELPPISSLDDVSDLSKYGSVMLFANRAAEVAPGFELDADSAPQVAQVVSMVDGLPLAIELAAAQMRRTALPELVVALDTHRELFVAKAPTIPPRHRALQHTLDWSYELLDPEERELFGRLGVLILEFPIEAAEVVCGGAGIDERDVPRLLQGLVDKSLVVADSRSGRTRFRLLDTVRTYAFDKIAQGYAIQHERGFMIGLAQRTDPALRGTTEQMWAWLLGGEREAIRATLAAAAGSFAEDQIGFLAGAVAALLTRTRRVAFLGGIDPDSTAETVGPRTAVFELMGRFRDGFRGGIRHVDGGVELLEEFMTDRLDFTAAFRDPLRAREVASRLYGDEVDVIFHAAGSVGKQVFGQARRASEDTGVHRWAIGVDHDEYLTVEAELKPYVASSAIKQIPGEPYRDLKRAIAAGTPFASPMFHLANEGVGLATSGGHLEPHLGTLAELRSQIIAGELETRA